MFAPAVLITAIEKAKEIFFATFVAPALSPVRIKATMTTMTTKTTKTRH